jgi:hypothetical protein
LRQFFANEPIVACLVYANVGRPYRVDSTLINPARTDLPRVGSLVGWLAQRDGFSSGVPPYVISPFPTCDSKVYITPGQEGACLGPRFDPFVLDDDLNAVDFHVRELALNVSLSLRSAFTSAWRCFRGSIKSPSRYTPQNPLSLAPFIKGPPPCGSPARLPMRSTFPWSPQLFGNATGAIPRGSRIFWRGVWWRQERGLSPR